MQQPTHIAKQQSFDADDGRGIADRGHARKRSSFRNSVDGRMKSARSSVTRASIVMYENMNLYSEQEDQDSKSKMLNRAFVCAIAVFMLWMSSLSVAILIVGSYIPSPEQDAVEDSCNYAYDTTVAQQQQYDDCAERQVDSCNIDFDRSFDNELTAVTVASSENQDMLTTASNIQSTCFTAYTTMRAASSQWISDGNVMIYVGPTGDCNATEQADLQTELSDSSQSQYAASQYTAESTEYSQSTVNNMADYATARADYDTQYIDDKTTGLNADVSGVLGSVNPDYQFRLNEPFVSIDAELGEILGCTTLAPGQSCSITSLRTLYDDAFTTLSVDIGDAELALDAMFDATSDLTLDVLGSLSMMSDFYVNVKYNVDFYGIDTSSWGNWWNLPLSSFTTSIPNWPDIPFAQLPFDADTVWSSVSSTISASVASVTSANIGAYDMGLDFEANLNTGLGNIEFAPDDYDPPQYESSHGAETPDEEASDHDQETDEMQGKTDSSIEEFNQLSAYEEPEEEGFTVYNFTKSSSTFVLSSTGYAYEDINGPGWSISSWLSAFSSIQGVLILMDVIFRVFKTVHYIYKWWSRSATRMPPADVRKDKAQYQLKSMSPQKMALNVVSHPAFFYCLFAFFGIYFVVNVAEAYIPVYNSYVDGCVQGSSNGTFLTENLYALAYNYASDEGNDESYNGIEDFNVKYADTCAAYGTSSQDQQSQDDLFLTSIKDVHADTLTDVDLFSRCVNMTTMDADFTSACCGEPGYPSSCSQSGTCPVNPGTSYPYLPLSQQSSTPECSTALSSYALEDGVFDCSSLPQCTITCQGPDKGLLMEVTKQCGCMVEYMVHSWWFQTAIALVVFLSMNMSRIVFTNGLTRVLWKNLTPNIFEYTATIRRNGKFVPPDDFGKEKSFRGDLKAQLDQVVKSYEIKGYLYLGLALLVNLPWIVFLLLTSNDMEYDPHQTSTTDAN